VDLDEDRPPEFNQRGNRRCDLCVILSGTAAAGGNVWTSRSAPVSAVVIVAAGLGIGGCGAAPDRAAPQTAASPRPLPSPPPKHDVHGTGHLRVTITPTRGWVGTDVTITATGCGDPDGRNHAVSFNPGFGNTLQSALARYDQRVISAHLANQALTARYRITAEDVRAARHADDPPPRFYVQCADDLADVIFLITH
jgi:hypothetical protein